MRCGRETTTSRRCGTGARVVKSELGVFELIDPDDPGDMSYPLVPSVAGDLMRHLADQLLAGRYVEEEIVNLILDHCDARDTPPIVKRYVELRRRHIPHGRMRVNNMKLVKYSTAKRDHYIDLVLGNASKNADRLPGGMEQAMREVADCLGMEVSTIRRRWTDSTNENKRGPGRPREK